MSAPAEAPFGAGLSRRILIGMALGIVAGLALRPLAPEGGVLHSLSVEGLLAVGGDLFVAALRMLVVPVVLVTLACGTAAVGDIARLSRIGGLTLLLYLGTTAIAVTIALVAATALEPGAGFDLPAETSFTAREAPSLTDVLIGLVPQNPIAALAEGRMLQVVVFSVLLGLALALSGEGGARVLSFMRDLEGVIMKLVELVMRVAHIGVFCLTARVFANLGFDAFAPLAKYFFLVLGVLLVHGFVTYPTLLRTLGGMRPIVFLREIRTVLAVAFSTSSSSATLPITLEVAERRLRVGPSVASFTLPLGATINMDGTAIMQGVATAFIAQAYGVDLSVGDLATVVLTATLASVGTAGVPGVGLIMLAMVLEQVGLPVEAIGVILGVDRLLDMTRTAVNVTGDLVVTSIMAKREDALGADSPIRRG